MVLTGIFSSIKCGGRIEGSRLLLVLGSTAGTVSWGFCKGFLNSDALGFNEVSLTFLVVSCVCLLLKTCELIFISKFMTLTFGLMFGGFCFKCSIMGNKSSSINNTITNVQNSMYQTNVQANVSENVQNSALCVSDQDGPILSKIPQTANQSLPLLSFIVTSFSGASYDDLFRAVPQVAPEGRISLYSLNLASIEAFFGMLTVPDACQNENVKSLIKEMGEVSPDAVLFNFECCSGCSLGDYHFPQRDTTLKLINHLLEKGHMVMCSDFAVKALINDWKETLGPNPFVKLGECDNFIELGFEPKSLVESPSKQLQMVGQLCQTGKTTIHALVGTVVFGVDRKKADNQIYNLNVLTVVTKAGQYAMNEKNLWEIKEMKGTVGHVLLKYKTGGILLLSAGHWIELANLNVDISNLEQVAMRNYGDKNEYMKEIDEIKNNVGLENEERSFRVNQLASKFVQQTAACNYSSKKKF